MNQRIILPGQGTEYDWSKDHIFVKTAFDLADGKVTVLEDTLKAGFLLPRHHHRVTTEVFYILEGEVEFVFDDGAVIATPGTTVNVPTHVWHEVRSPGGGRLLTIFAPGGFDRCLAEMAALTPEQSADETFVTAVAEKHDSWRR